MDNRAGASQPGAEAGLMTVRALQAANVAVNGPLHSLLPEGVMSGSTVAVAGSTALALAFAAALAGSQRWVAGIGWGPFGLVAAHELGLSWERLVVVDAAGTESWTAAVAATLDAFDIVVARATRGMAERDARRLMARARERRRILVIAGTGREPGAGWPMADVRLCATSRRWDGLGDGHGYLQRRLLEVGATGKGRLARGRRQELWLPGAGGRPAAIAAAPTRTVVPMQAAPGTDAKPVHEGRRRRIARPVGFRQDVEDPSGPPSSTSREWCESFS